MYTVGGIRHVGADPARAGDTRRAGPPTSEDRDEAPGAPAAASPSDLSRALPEPGPAKVRSPVGTKAAGYAVGVLLYQLLCNGHHPFPNAMPTVGKPVTDPTAIRRDLNPDLATVLIQACAPASADRFATAADMRLALRNIRAGL